ncbi:hypothetical protein BDR04DRAFT_1098492 [Suillus decipiens]|nr:hypothetical protein BDR04DRAFT_1098492 [Suillus decipiens]
MIFTQNTRDEYVFDLSAFDNYEFFIRFFSDVSFTYFITSFVTVTSLAVSKLSKQPNFSYTLSNYPYPRHSFNFSHSLSTTSLLYPARLNAMSFCIRLHLIIRLFRT